MKIDIPYYIRQILREQRKVSLPGVGTFYLDQVASSLSEDRSTMHPPQLKLDFQSDDSTYDTLATYIADLGVHSDSVIQNAISQYADYLLEKLVGGQSCEVAGVGVLDGSGDGGAVTFIPALSDLTREYKDLPIITASPVEKMTPQAGVQHAVDTSDIDVRAPRSTWWYPILAGIFIAALAILLVKTCRGGDDDLYNDNQGIEQEAAPVPQSQPAIDTAVEQELNRKYREVDSLLEGKVDSGLGGGKLAEELSQLEQQDQELDEAKSQPRTVDDVLATGSSDGTTAVTDSKYRDIIPPSGQCIIILGSFRKATNITRMMSIVERDGKELYTSQHEGLTRVGFTFDCTTIELDEYLTDIRSRLSSKAWYLDPTVTIAYQ